MKIMHILCALCLVGVCAPAKAKDKSLTMLVGTYTNGSSDGIYVYRLDTDKQTATLLGQTAADNPSYLAVSKDARFVYAVSESGDSKAAVNAYSFDKKNGQLQFLNKTNVGAGPCFIYLDAQNRFVATANYGGGSVSVIPVAADGTLMPSEETYAFSGSGKDPVRQDKPHMHCVVVSPDQQMLFSTDLGTDSIYRFSISPRKTINKGPFLQPKDLGSVKVAPGSGPRHMIFNAAGTMAYLINELSGTVTAFNYVAMHPGNLLKEVQTIVADTCHAGGSADIHLSPDENFLYVSTRLKGDGIVIFKVEEDGKLTRIGYQPTGKHPRNFAITPDGRLMLVACKDGGMIQIFSIDKKTGLLTDTGRSIPLDQPVCIRFVE